MHKKIADLFGIFIKSAYICIINKGDKLTSSPLSKFEIVFSSLYKFCEGMFRRETVHSHFFVPPSLFRFSVPVPCCPFEAEISFCRNVPLPKALRMGLSPPHCRRRRGDVSGRWWVSARMGRPGYLGRRRASMVGI